jgi:hypothetical protein
MEELRFTLWLRTMLTFWMPVVWGRALEGTLSVLMVYILAGSR